MTPEQSDKPDSIDGQCETPLDDLERSALAHYEYLSSKEHCWLSTIPHAIKFYFDAKRKSALPDIQPLAGDTPRTEAFAKALALKMDGGYDDEWYDWHDYARQLERELASKTRDADHFFQLSGRYLEELNAARSARPLPCDESLRVAEKLENGWKEIRAFFRERNWPDTKLSDAAQAIDWNMPVILNLLRTGEVRSTSGLMDEAGKFFDWGNAASVALRNLLEAYERRIRSLCTTPEELAAKPWECAEYLEARRVLVDKPNWFVDVSNERPDSTKENPHG